MKDFPLFKNHDWFLTISTILLLAIGIIVIYSATFTPSDVGRGMGMVNRQLVIILLGFLVYFFVSTVDPAFFKYGLIQAAIVFVSLGLLIYVWQFGDPVRNTNRWIEWGFIRIQPSELAKVVLILLNSAILSNVFQNKDKSEDTMLSINGNENSRHGFILETFKNLFQVGVIKYFLISILISALYVVLILIEPALGTATITALICISIMIMSAPDQKALFAYVLILLLSINIIGGFVSFNTLYNRIGVSLMIESFDLMLLFLSIIGIILLIYFLRLKIITAGLVMLVGFGGISLMKYGWDNVIKDYQKDRIEVFFNPEADPQGDGWQLRQSKIAIGSGRIFGKGFLQGSQSKLRYLPEAHTDFIFAAYCEEFGMVGAILLLSLYAFLVTRIIRASANASTFFESLICFGIAVMIILHIFINIGMNIGIMPITGIPLPLVSYGGSSIMVTLIGLGIVQAVNNNHDNVSRQEKFLGDNS